MCVHYSANISKKKIQERFNVDVPTLFEPIHYANAYTKPLMPVVTNVNSKDLQMFQWGLIPLGASTNFNAEDFKASIKMARQETIFEKSIFSKTAQTQRCLVLSSAYIEYHHIGKNKYPYLIYKKNKEPFAMAGIWTKYNSLDGSTTNTFSLITTDANDFTKPIHNSQERMPVILQPQNESLWLSDTADYSALQNILKTDNNLELNSHTIGKKLSNSLSTLQEKKYQEIENPNLSLFD